MRALVKSTLVVAAVTALGVAGITAASAHTAVPHTAVPHTATTTADIVCTAPNPMGPFKPPVATQASGNGYLAHLPIVVEEVISLNGKAWTGSKTAYTTSDEGDWTTPTTPYPAAEPGLYEYNVTVTDPDGKITYGTAYDACKF